MNILHHTRLNEADKVTQRAIRSLLTVTTGLGIAAMIVLTGCDRIQKKEKRDELEISGAVLAKLNDGYMNGNLEEARQNLLKAEQFLDENHERYIQARGHLLNYARLCALERAGGNSNLVEIYFVKLQYWRTIDMEERGFTTEQIVPHLENLTPDKVINDILKWDRDGNGGKEPQYLKSIKRQPPVSVPSPTPAVN